MTYGRELFASRSRALDGAVVSHSAELVSICDGSQA